MKFILTHPLRDWWLKLLRPVSPPSLAQKRPMPLTRPKAHRTTSFFELP